MGRLVAGPLAPLVVRDRFDSLSKIARVSAPVVLLHGSRDDVVPVAMGRRLAAARPDARYVEVPGATHNDFPGLAGAPLPGDRGRSSIPLRHAAVERRRPALRFAPMGTMTPPPGQPNRGPPSGPAAPSSDHRPFAVATRPLRARGDRRGPLVPPAGATFPTLALASATAEGTAAGPSESADLLQGHERLPRRLRRPVVRAVPGVPVRGTSRSRTTSGRRATRPSSSSAWTSRKPASR